MGMVIGLFLLALLVLGLLNRKKQNREWKQAERHDERGLWIDKRPGERGTIGSLDEEMEANRHFIAQQNNVSELARLVQGYCFEHHPDFHRLTDAQIHRHWSLCKSEASALLGHLDELLKGRASSVQAYGLPADSLRAGLKKQVLGYAYERFPDLLGIEIPQIQTFDLAAEHLADRVLGEIVRL